MPAINVVKQYVEGGIYHLYNRCPDGNTLFKDHQDYEYFLQLLKEYLSEEYAHDHLTGLLKPTNLATKAQLYAYCLLPNHFHLLIQQNDNASVSRFARCVMTSYALRFNRKYHHIGSIFQGKLRGILIDSDCYLLHVTRYIHRNALPFVPSYHDLAAYPYSSYGYYLNQKHASWINPKPVLAYFASSHHEQFSNYQSFVEFEDEVSDLVVRNLRIE